MRRLSGQDDGFLHLESPTAPMNSMAVGVLVPATGPGGEPKPITMDDVRAHFRRELEEMPSLRWRIEQVPLGLHHPVAIEDPDFDLEYHLRHATVAAPGGPEQLDRLVADLAEKHLDRRHPLWQFTLVDGLAGGRQAGIYRVQHALQDGVAAYTSFSRVFSGADHQPEPRAEPWQSEEPPGRIRLIIDAIVDLVHNLRRLPALVMRTYRGQAAVKARQEASAVKVPGFVKDTPPCSLNDAFTIGRSYARSSLALEDLKRVKNAAGVSLNDVVLGVVATALRRYLLDRGDLPERPLVANVPVGYEPADAPVRQFGNRFTNITASLATDIADPWERLLRISAVATEAKACLDLAGPEMMADWLEMVPPFIAAPGIRSLQKRRDEHREEAEHSIVISNLKGPSEPWYFETSLVESLHIQGPPSNGVGPNVMLWSYADRLLIGVLTFTDAMDDPHQFSASIADALDEYLELARVHEAAAMPAPADA